MERIEIRISRREVQDEVAKATDYTGSKMPAEDAGARERILITDEALADMGRFWDEAAMGADDALKEMLLRGADCTGEVAEDGLPGDYVAVLEVSGLYDKGLTGSVEKALRGYFVASITGRWFQYVNKGEAADYLTQATELIMAAERMLYSRRRPQRPTCKCEKNGRRKER